MDLDSMDERSLLATLEDACECFTFVNNALCGVQGVMQAHKEDTEGQTVVALEAICDMMPHERVGLEGLGDTVKEKGRAIVDFIRDVLARLVKMVRDLRRKKKPAAESGSQYDAVKCRVVELNYTSTHPHSIADGLYDLIRGRSSTAIVELLELKGVSEGEVLDSSVVTDAWRAISRDSGDVPGADAEENGLSWWFAGNGISFTRTEKGGRIFTLMSSDSEPTGDYSVTDGTYKTARLNVTMWAAAHEELYALYEPLINAITKLQDKYSKVIRQLERNDGELLDRILVKDYKAIGDYVSSTTKVGTLVAGWMRVLDRAIVDQELLMRAAERGEY